MRIKYTDDDGRKQTQDAAGDARQGFTGDAAHTAVQNWGGQLQPADRHDEQGGTGTNAADVRFSTTDSTNFNEHILEVTAGAVTLTVGINDTSTPRNIFVEELDVADQLGAQITGVGLPVGIYRFKGNYTVITVVQSGAAASASDLASYVK